MFSWWLLEGVTFAFLLSSLTMVKRAKVNYGNTCVHFLPPFQSKFPSSHLVGSDVEHMKLPSTIKTTDQLCPKVLN